MCVCMSEGGNYDGAGASHLETMAKGIRRKALGKALLWDLP